MALVCPGDAGDGDAARRPEQLGFGLQERLKHGERGDGYGEREEITHDSMVLSMQARRQAGGGSRAETSQRQAARCLSKVEERPLCENPLKFCQNFFPLFQAFKTFK